MNSQDVVPIPLHVVETIADEIQEMYDKVTRRAYEIFQQRGEESTLDLEDWLTAERELVHKPNVHIEETIQRIIVTVYLRDVSPLEVQLLITPEAMLIHGPSTGLKKLFRAVQFPRRIDVNNAEALYGDGCLYLMA
jgi:HSP20 family molecular chaperone IbpA